MDEACMKNKQTTIAEPEQAFQLHSYLISPKHQARFSFYFVALVGGAWHEP